MNHANMTVIGNMTGRIGSAEQNFIAKYVGQG
jgi:hypothetical protein